MSNEAGGAYNKTTPPPSLFYHLFTERVRFLGPSQRLADHLGRYLEQRPGGAYSDLVPETPGMDLSYLEDQIGAVLAELREGHTEDAQLLLESLLRELSRYC